MDKYNQKPRGVNYIEKSYSPKSYDFYNIMESQSFTGPMFLGKDLEYVEQGYVIIKDNKIIDCGEGKISGAKNHSIIPAFINAHTHTGDHFLRERCLNMTLEAACAKRGIKENCLSAASEDTIIHGMKTAISEMIRTGTCCFTDFREGGKPGINLLKKALLSFRYRGMRAKIYARPLYHGENFIDHCDGYGMRSIRAEKIKMRLGRSLGIHVCETKPGELEKALDFKPDFLVHMNNATKEELKKASSLNLPIIICPRSNAYFSLNPPDASAMLEEGINISLGTDNAMTNTPSMPSEIEYTYRTNMKKVSAKEILKMATINPAKLFTWNCGSIEKGKDANILLLNESFLKTPDPYATTILRLQAQKPEIMFGGKFVHYY